MSSVSKLTLRGALNDPALRESLLASLLMLIASAGLVFLASWVYVIRAALRRAEPHGVDRLIVCGHLLEAGRPSAIYRTRLERAASLAASDPGLALLLAGGGQPSEAAVGREWLVAEYGIDPKRIGLEEASTDTFENLRHARELLPREARLGVVTSRFHLARVVAYARQLGLDAVPVPAESRWRWTGANLAASVREAGFLCWFACGRAWARVARRRHLLERIH